MLLSCTAPWTLWPKKHTFWLQTQGISVGALCKPQRTCQTHENGTALSFTNDHHQFDFTLINYAAASSKSSWISLLQWQPLCLSWGRTSPCFLGAESPLALSSSCSNRAEGQAWGRYLCQSVKPHLKAEPTGCVHASRHQPTWIMIFKARSSCYQDMLSERQTPLFSNPSAVLVPPGMCVSRQADRQASLPACSRHFQGCINRGKFIGEKWRKESWVGNKVNPEPSSPSELLKAINMKNANPMLGLMCLRQLGLAVYAECSSPTWTSFPNFWAALIKIGLRCTKCTKTLNVQEKP